MSETATTTASDYAQQCREELQAIHNATIIAVCEALNIPVDVRMVRVDEVQSKAFTKKAQVKAATTVEEVEAIEWEEQV